MTTHPSAEIRSRYAEGRLDPKTLLDVDDHLATCPECRAALAPHPSRAAASMRDALAGEHPAYERIEAYVDGAEAPEVEAHLEICPMCAAEMRDLRSQARMPHPRAWTWWAVAAAVLVAFLGAFALFRPPRAREIVVPAAISAAPVAGPAETASAADPFAFAQLTPSLRRTFEQLRAGVIPGAAIDAELRGDLERTRGEIRDRRPLAVVAPLGVVEETRPLFRWTAQRRAGWIVEVFDASYRRAARSETLTATEWRPAAPLRRGETYSWQVAGGEIRAPEPPAPPARFRILDERSAAELAEARAAGSHLAAALVCAREGILDCAAREMKRAQAQQPESKEIAEALRTLSGT